MSNATTIDQLVVTLGLDASKFGAGQKQAANTLQTLSRNVSNASAGIGESLAGIAKKFAIVVGAFEGLKEAIRYAKELTDQFASLDVSMSVLGLHAKQLQTLREVSRMAGGSPQAGENYIEDLKMAQANLRLNGQYDPRFTAFARIGLPLTGGNDIGDPGDFLRQIASALHNAPGEYGSTESGRAIYAESQLGMTHEQAALVANLDKLNSYLKTARHTNRNVTDEQAHSAKRLQNTAIDYETKLEDLTAKSFPVLAKAAEGLAAIFDQLSKSIAGKKGTPGSDFDPRKFIKRAVTSFFQGEGAIGLAVADTVLNPSSPSNPVVGLGVKLGEDLGQNKILPALHSAEQWGGGLIDAIKSFFGGSASHGSGAPGAAAAAGGTQIAIGNITINTQATDAAGIAGDIKSTLQLKFNQAFADTGVTP